MRDPAGKPAPAGGFQQGGWYSGYQYYNGSFAPQAGVIHPSSPQAGAGQAVSAEVNRQSSVAQGKAPDAIQNYINQQNQMTTPAPTSAAGRTAAPGTSGIPGASGGGAGYMAPEVLNLPKLYESLYASSGIADVQAQLLQQDKEFTEAKAKINDNPFLSEATRVGRLAKLEQLYNERTANSRKDIETRKADIETKLNLETKQFDINSQAAQQNFAKFQTLLQMGALDNASGEDIANITRATGISSSLIYSAVQANKAKNVKTQVISFDDGVNQGFAVINADTGEVIKQQIVAASKQTVTGGGSGGTSLLNQARQLDLEKAQAPQVLLAGAKMGKTLDDMIQFGLQFGLSPQEIFNIYMSVDYYHNTSDQIKEAKKKYGIK